MKNYYYTDGNEKFGPFTLEELKGKKITRNTLVWYSDLLDWKRAGEIPELQELLSIGPPDIKPEVKEFTEIKIKNVRTGKIENVSQKRYNEIIETYGEKNFAILAYLDEHGEPIGENSLLEEKYGPPKSYLTESILVTLFCCLPFGIVGIVYASKVNSQFRAGNYTAAEESSKNANKWTMYGFYTGLVLGVINLLVRVAGVY